MPDTDSSLATLPSLDQLRAKGMTIHKPSAKLQADMKQVGQVMQADWLKKAGADGQAVVDAYKKM